MIQVEILLFGRFSFRYQGVELVGLDLAKVQELLCYLLLYRNRSHARETLAGLLWGDSPAVQAKKQLRQTLWQLQSALEGLDEKLRHAFLAVEPDWVCLNLTPVVTLDVASFVQAATLTKGIAGHEFDRQQYTLISTAVQFYRGDLLEGYYQDWCLYEREYLQNAYLTMLDKLMDYCIVHQNYEAGLEFGARALRLDRARERTQRQMIRLYYLLGDRTGALRQYQRCVTALREELAVEPAALTVQLYHKIRNDLIEQTVPASPAPMPPPTTQLSLALEHLQHMQSALHHMQSQLTQDIQVIQLALNGG